jgi:LysR family transcriptional regulator (chromosome initiation inhibitor)
VEGLDGIDLDRLRALAAAVSEGTFEGAARALHVTPSAISQRIKALETALGRVLLTRSKPVRATPSGQAVLRAARQIEIIAADLSRELSIDEAVDPMVIPLAVNADSLATWFLPALARAGDSLFYDIRRSDEGQSAELLRQGAVMAVVTASSAPVPGCTVERLGAMRYRPRAAPAFVRHWFPDGPTPARLTKAPVIVFDRDDQLQDVYLRRACRRQVEPPRHFVPGSDAFMEAIQLGLGWGMLPDLQAARAQRDLVDFDLVDFDPDGGVAIRLYWQQWRLRSPALDRVAQAVREAATTALS